jgi:predicted permease
MVQSFARLTRVDPGFDADGVLTVEIGLPYSQAENHERIYNAVIERVRALPGVTSAAMVGSVPLAGGLRASRLRASDRPVRPEEKGRQVALEFFTPGYLQTMRTPVVEGIGFAPGEHVEAAHPVLLSASLARRLFPGESALGKPVRRLGSSGEENPRQPDYTVAGVVADVRNTSLRADPTEIVYVPVIEPRVEPNLVPTDMSLVIRSTAPTLPLTASVRSAIREVAPELALGRVRSMDSIVRRSTARESFLTVLLLVAAASSLFLGLVGIYGVVAYAVQRREQEIGIRVALGATAGQVTGLVLREWFRILAAGLVVGTLTALASTRALRSMLFEVSPTDPLTLGGVAVLLAAVALVASLVPARRAARTDPMVALRAE